MSDFTKYTISEPWLKPKSHTIILMNDETARLYAGERFISQRAPKNAVTEIHGENGYHVIIENKYAQT